MWRLGGAFAKQGGAGLLSAVLTQAKYHQRHLMYSFHTDASLNGPCCSLCVLRLKTPHAQREEQVHCLVGS